MCETSYTIGPKGVFFKCSKSGKNCLSMSTCQPSLFPKDGLVFSIRADNDNGQIVDSVTGIQIRKTGGGISTVDGYRCWDLDNAYLERSGGSQLTEGQYYTHAVWLKWRSSDSGWRTVMRPSNDHSVIIRSGTKDLGMFSNRNGEFRDSRYDITNDMSTLQLVIVTGEGNSATSNTGTSTFYTGALGSGSVTRRGTSDRVVSGTTWYRLGWGGQGPGKVAAAYEWNRVLTIPEMNSLLKATPTGGP
mmetsp:Transcript_3432/g.6083  ORF Transcript_3432/g.6083 Transcript_3432/m.6083 type:complete len:246 (+) Transcript_3432:247-984(+)